MIFHQAALAATGADSLLLRGTDGETVARIVTELQQLQAASFDNQLAFVRADVQLFGLKAAAAAAASPSAAVPATAHS